MFLSALKGSQCRRQQEGEKKVVSIVVFVSLILHFPSFMVIKVIFISVHFIAVDISCLLMSKQSK